MCVIINKPIGAKLPSENELRNCWDNNPDGAGVAIWDNKINQARIYKGFMKIEHYIHFIEKLAKVYDIEKTAMVLHFRITSVGATSKGQTHPFPLSDKNAELASTQTTSNIAIAHNGTMDIAVSKNMSDTQTFIRDFLTKIYASNNQFYTDDNLMDLIGEITTSKLSFLHDGKIHTVGDFDYYKGCEYSNKSYVSYTEKFGSAYWHTYGDIYYNCTLRELASFLTDEISETRATLQAGDTIFIDSDLIQEIETRTQYVKYDDELSDAQLVLISDCADLLKEYEELIY
jgi:hypothetical protein